MAFNFRLQKVLKHRQRLVDSQAQELAEAGRKVVAVEKEISNLDATIARFESDSPSNGATLPVSDRINLTTWILHLREQRSLLFGRLVDARENHEAERVKMTAAWQDLEVLKKLRARQRELWAEELMKRENLELDEVGVQRSDRLRRERIASE